MGHDDCETNLIHTGDAFDILPELPAESMEDDPIQVMCPVCNANSGEACTHTVASDARGERRIPHESRERFARIRHE